MPRLKTISAPLKIVLRLTAISFPLKAILTGVKRVRINMARLRIVYIHALRRLNPLTMVFGDSPTEACSVASIESTLFIRNLLLVLDR
jgi:hypothetical protein